jgi:putative hydrolase of the HAD superfamily
VILAKAIIFDLFETLVDFSYDEYRQVLYSMAACIGMEPESFISSWDASWYEHEAGAYGSVAEYVTAITGVPVAEAELTRAVSLHGTFQKEALIPRNETLAVLQNLKNRGFKIGLVTNCPVETPLYWPESPLSALIDVSVFSTVEKARKPDPSLFKICANRLGFVPSDCYFIGDGANQELFAASDVGMHAIKLNSDERTDEKNAPHWDGPSISSLSELLTYIEKDVS